MVVMAFKMLIIMYYICHVNVCLIMSDYPFISNKNG